jgi:hypothetical protein
MTALLLLSLLAAAHLGLSASVAHWSHADAIGLATLALCCEYVDSTLGMGYGTALTPLLMLLWGLEPLAIVPCVLISELATGLAAGAAHHAAGNVSFRRRSAATKIAAVLSACSVLGASTAVVVAIHIPTFWLKLVIGVIVLGMGVFLLGTRNRRFPFAWWKVTALGLVAAFNKGMSGGGYGPLVTGGQIVSGVGEKSAIGITSVAEGITCIVGVTAYLVAGQSIRWDLALPLTLGALASIPFCALTVNRMSTKLLRALVGVLASILGLFTLVRLF